MLTPGFHRKLKGRGAERLEESQDISVVESHMMDWLVHAGSSTTEIKCEFHTHYHLPDLQNAIPAAKVEADALEKEFNERADRWEKESSIHSSPGEKFMHRDYLRIIGKGEQVVPLILKRLQSSKKDWLFALENIVSEEESPAKGIENFKGAVEAWLGWGRKKYPTLT
jgi:hypothetical protein